MHIQFRANLNCPLGVRVEPEPFNNWLILLMASNSWLMDNCLSVENMDHEMVNNMYDGYWGAIEKVQSW